MPNPQFAPEEYDVSKSKNYDRETMATPGDTAPTRLDKTGQRGSKDPGGDMSMRYGTADWKMPGGFTMQKRDRTWGMRQADGYAMDQGLANGKAETAETVADETYVSRGSVRKSAAPKV